MKYNPQIHHRRSIRLKGYDYSQAGLYFITICCANRECFFGEITTVGTRHDDVGTRHDDVGTHHDDVGTHHDDVGTHHDDVGTRHGVSLRDIGKIANECWLQIPEHFPNAILHEHIVMPNHVHGIIELINDDNVGTRHGVSLPNNTGNIVGTSHGMSLPSQHEKSGNQFGKPVSGSLSVIVNQYKSSVKRWCNKNGHPYFKWQTRFHDHIIRNEQSYQTISDYIINNPAKWKEDKFFIFI